MTESPKPIRVPLELLKQHEDFGKKQLLQLSNSPDWVVRHVTAKEMLARLEDADAAEDLGMPTDPRELCDVAKKEFDTLRDRHGMALAPFSMFVMNKGGGRTKHGKPAIFVAVKKIEGLSFESSEDLIEEGHAPALLDLYRTLYGYLDGKFIEAQENPDSKFLWDIMGVYQYILAEKDGREEFVLVDLDPLVGSTRAMLATTVRTVTEELAVMIEVYREKGESFRGIAKEFQALSERIASAGIF